MDNDILNLLDAALKADAVIDIADSDADAILMKSPECDAASLQRMKRRFVEQVLLDLNKSPITEANETPSANAVTTHAALFHSIVR